MTYAFFAFLWLIFVAWAYYKAQEKCRNAGLWALATFISPLAFIALCCMPELKKCAKCAEGVRVEAEKCRYCGSKV